nr:MAG TPA: hypothetical protein [Caudoviricetes sp.]
MYILLKSLFSVAWLFDLGELVESLGDRRL